MRQAIETAQGRFGYVSSNWIGGIALALALLVVQAVLYLVWFVNPNAWRARIAQSASDSLGRQVQLDLAGYPVPGGGLSRT